MSMLQLSPSSQNYSHKNLWNDLGCVFYTVFWNIRSICQNLTPPVNYKQSPFKFDTDLRHLLFEYACIRTSSAAFFSLFCLCKYTYMLHTQEQSHMMLYIDPNVPSALLSSTCPVEQELQQRMMKKTIKQNIWVKYLQELNHIFCVWSFYWSVPQLFLIYVWKCIECWKCATTMHTFNGWLFCLHVILKTIISWWFSIYFSIWTHHKRGYFCCLVKLDQKKSWECQITLNGF